MPEISSRQAKDRQEYLALCTQWSQKVIDTPYLGVREMRKVNLRRIGLALFCREIDLLAQLECPSKMTRPSPRNFAATRTSSSMWAVLFNILMGRQR